MWAATYTSSTRCWSKLYETTRSINYHARLLITWLRIRCLSVITASMSSGFAFRNSSVKNASLFLDIDKKRWLICVSSTFDLKIWAKNIHLVLIAASGFNCLVLLFTAAIIMMQAGRGGGEDGKVCTGICWHLPLLLHPIHLATPLWEDWHSCPDLRCKAERQQNLCKRPKQLWYRD